MLFTKLVDWRGSPAEQFLDFPAANFEHGRGDAVSLRV